MKKIIPIISLIIIAVIIIFLTNGEVSLNKNKNSATEKTVTSFEECVEEGNPVMESYPRQCISKSGEHFTEDIDIDIKKDFSSSELVIGSWRSIDDEKFVRVFSEENRVSDYYEDKQAGGTGSWMIFSGDKPVGNFPFELDVNSEYLVIIFNEETLFFEVSNVNNSELELVYLGGNSVLKFVRIPEIV